MLSKLLNVNFGEVFKPLHPFAEKVAKAKQQLQNGAAPEDVFDEVGHFYDGLARVKLGGKCNFIKPDGNFLRDDLWFNDVGNFYNGFAKVKLDNKWNYIKPDGNFLRDDLWFDDAECFYEGFASVELDGKQCCLDTKGNLYDKNKNLINKVNENKRRVVRLTESQLRNTIKSVVAQYLNESRRR